MSPIRVRATGLDKWIGCIGHKWRPQKRGKGACVWESERDRITFLGYIQFISVLSTTRFLLFPLNGGMLEIACMHGCHADRKHQGNIMRHVVGVFPDKTIFPHVSN